MSTPTEKSKGIELINFLLKEHTIETRTNHNIGCVSIVDRVGRHRYKFQFLSNTSVVVKEIPLIEIRAKDPDAWRYGSEKIPDASTLLQVDLRNPDSLHQIGEVVETIKSKLIYSQRK